MTGDVQAEAKERQTPCYGVMPGVKRSKNDAAQSRMLDCASRLGGHENQTIQERPRRGENLGGTSGEVRGASHERTMLADFVCVR